MPVVIGFVVGVAITSVLWWFWPKRKSSADRDAPARLGTVDLSRAEIDALAGEPLFIDYLMLGRISNALRFAQSAPLEVHREGTPRASRQMNNAFLTQVAFAIEALDTLKLMGRNLKERRAWRERIVPLFRDPEIKQLETETVRDLRNRVAFHFDRDALKEGLTQAPIDSTTVLAMRGTRKADSHFQLSDEAAISFLIPMRDLGPEQGAQHFLDWGRRVSQLSLEIADAVEHVAVDIGMELGFSGVWTDEVAAQATHST